MITITIDRATVEQALEALEAMQSYAAAERKGLRICDEAIPALRAALAQQAEPMALDWLHKWANQDDGEPETQWHEGYEAARRVVQIHLTAPPQRKPLTEEEIKTAFHAARNAKLGASQDNSRHRLSVIEIARAVEKAVWEKNHGQA